MKLLKWTDIYIYCIADQYEHFETASKQKACSQFEQNKNSFLLTHPNDTSDVPAKRKLTKTFVSSPWQ